MGSLVSSVGSMLGIGNPNGADYTAQGINPGQLNTSYGQTNAVINQQQAMANALQGQGAQGIASQNQLTQALQAQAMGQGPNPAQAALAQSTGQNVANQAALAAGQRGAAQNVGMIAREVGQQGANTQQQAVGQAATMQAQQQLAAQQQLGQLAAGQIGQQSNALGALSNGTLQNQGQLIGLQSGMNSANAGMAQTNAQTAPKLLGGLMNGAGGASTMGKFDGGTIPGEPKVNKNDPKNDTVPAKLSPGEIVIPLDVLNSKDPVKASAEFVAKELKKQKGHSASEENEFKTALKKAIGERKK